MPDDSIGQRQGTEILADLTRSKENKQRDERPYCFALNGKHKQPDANQINQRSTDNQQRIGFGFVFEQVFIPAGSQDMYMIDDDIIRNSLYLGALADHRLCEMPEQQAENDRD